MTQRDTKNSVNQTVNTEFLFIKKLIKACVTKIECTMKLKISKVLVK